jgi:hypothetical protein
MRQGRRQGRHRGQRRRNQRDQSGPRARATQRILESSRRSVAAAVVLACGVLHLQPVHATPAATALELTYAAAGLNERAAAAHLLDRLAFGARPGDIDRLLEIGLSEWIEIQLAGSAVESQLEKRLAPYDALRLSAEDLAETFPPPGAALRLAMRDGTAPRSASDSTDQGHAGSGRGTGDDVDDVDGERDRRREAVAALREQGRRSPRELVGQLQAQKVVRAVYAENQLHEVLVDFWFNHFNVSTTDNQARGYVLAYERDAVRPRVTGSFRDLLEATARHPAMLQYLDNAQSRAEEGRRVAFDAERERLRSRTERAGRAGGRSGMRPGMSRPPGQVPRSGGRLEAPRGGDRSLAAVQSNRPRGLNENYARELLELHTLGVDGGYTQQDVVEVARAFTGWSVLPPRGLRPDGTGPELQRLQRTARAPVS